PFVSVMPMDWSWALHFCQSALTTAILDSGIDESFVLVDGAAIPPLRKDSDVIGAGYVYNFATVSLDPDVATTACQAMRDVLVSRGLPVDEFAPAAKRVVFTGLDILGDVGIVRCKIDRLCRLRQALLGLLRRGFASPLALSAVVGHCAWGMISNRPMLSIFNSVYRFMGLDSRVAAPLWPSVIAELRAAATLIPLWWADVRAEWSATTFCSDASPYGIGVCRKTVDQEVAAAAGRLSDRWRYRFSDAVHARARALGIEPRIVLETAVDKNCLEECSHSPRPPKIPGGPPSTASSLHQPADAASLDGFDEVPDSITAFDGWATIHSSRHSRFGLDIMRYEADALGFAMRHSARSGRLRHHRILFTVDNLALALAAGKGRSGARGLRDPLRRLCALSAASGIRCAIRWIPSESNVADSPSRTRTHPGPVLLARGALSVLESAAVSDTTMANYWGAAKKFEEWCRWTSQTFSTAAEVDAILVAYFVNLFLDGFDSATGRVLMASLKHYLPAILVGRAPCPRAARALAGWRKLVPPQMRLPLPRAAMASIVGVLISWKLFGMAVFIRLMFDTYLRPSEACRLAAGGVMRPRPDGALGYGHWALIVNDACFDRPGKTSEMDESVIVDNQTIWPLLEALVHGKGPIDGLWTFAPDEVRSMFRRAAAALGLGAELTLYPLRHGGASDDLLSLRRTRKEVKDRGRWRTDQSLLRDAKRARMQQRIANLGQNIVEFGEQVDRQMNDLIIQTT
ncbi:unnamed protein product, partial [Prorocentrum cordatum]